ncbi:MAG: LOG family protein [Deltaproteobacteria bacterium]|nr:LOG family protein [Deltaproteobacteria bacterium]
MKLKIGVMGSAGGELMAERLSSAFVLGQAIGQANCYLVTGGCPGLPLEAARGARAAGGLVIGISPGLSLDEHIHKYGSPIEAHDLLIFTGSGLMGREVVNIRSSDIVVIIGGSSGTLGELAIAYDEGKLIGILQGSGGISEIAADILAACKKETGARVFYERDPQRLVTKLLDVYRTVHHVKPSCFCEDRADCPCCAPLHVPAQATDTQEEKIKRLASDRQ